MINQQRTPESTIICMYFALFVLCCLYVCVVFVWGTLCTGNDNYTDVKHVLNTHSNSNEFNAWLIKGLYTSYRCMINSIQDHYRSQLTCDIGPDVDPCRVLVPPALLIASFPGLSSQAFIASI